VSVVKASNPTKDQPVYL